MIKSTPIRTVGIIGGGPSGLSTAYFLRNKSLKVEVIESASHLGGLAQSFNLWGRHIELGAHFLAYDECIPLKSMIMDLFNNHEFILYNRKTHIVKEVGRLFFYPPSIKDLLHSFTKKELIEASVSYLKAKTRKNATITAKEALVTSFGDYLYHFFFHDYSLKIWGRSCSELDPCFSESMLPFRGKHHIWSTMRKKKNRVVYFEKGLNELWERLKDECMIYDVAFRLNNGVKQFRKHGEKINITFQDGSETSYDNVISTLPDSVNRTLFGLEKKQTYQYRDLILVYLKVNKSHLLDSQCLYIYSKDIQAARVVDFSLFPNTSSVPNIFLLEYWTDLNGLSNASDHTLMEIVHKDLKKLNLTFSYEDFYIKRLSKTYRIPELGLVDKIKTEKKDLNNTIFSSIGRSNSPSFNYGMDNAIMEAYELSKTF